MTSIEEFSFELPETQIAQEPSDKRDASRTLFLKRGQVGISEGHFADLFDHLQGDECLVVNNTRVIPARLHLKRQSGGKVEAFMLSQVEGNH